MHAIDRCNGIQSMQGLTALHVASEHGHLPIVDFLLNKGSDLDAKTARGQGEAPLHYACRNGHLHIVKLLLVHNASVSVKNIVRTMIMM
jgi:ankyrin repeat protein